MRQQGSVKKKKREKNDFLHNSGVTTGRCDKSSTRSRPR